MPPPFSWKPKVTHLSISSMGELAGWGLPEHFPHRNNRTNMVLFALGARTVAEDEP